jgi:hypothetical protein
MRGLRHTLVHIALAALILRAFLPTGWMPNPQGPTEGAFVICTMDGPVQTTDGKVLPGKDDPRAHEACPFAAAPHLATPLVMTAMPLPMLAAVIAHRASHDTDRDALSPYAPQSPRAPPELA